MDRSVKPGDSFWHFVNGSWDKRTEIPADRTNAGVSVLLVEEAERQVRAIVEDLARDPDQGGRAGRQVGDFYASWMDTAAIEANGTAPLKPYLSKIDAVRNRADLLKLFATPGYATPVEVGIIPDPADPTRYVAVAAAGESRAADRDFYLLTGDRYDAIRTAYRTYIVTLHTLAGIGDADAKMQRADRPRDGAGQSVLGASAPAGYQADLPPDEPHAAERARAAVRVGRVSQGRRSRPKSPPSSHSRRRRSPKPARCSTACRCPRGKSI